MTYIAKLVKRLRDKDAPDGKIGWVHSIYSTQKVKDALCAEAADALEAQAKEIKIYQQTELTYVTRVADAQREYSEMQAKLEARIAERIAEQDFVLEMKWRAEDRAIKAWQAKTGERMTWPDQAKLVEWLMDELHAARARIAELEAALNGWQQWWELPWQDRRPDIAERCYRAAAALKGEKG